MNILVITLTCGRLDVTKQWLPELEKKAGYPYKHIVVDNGSQDGTADWLVQQGYDVVLHDDNKGIMKGWARGYRAALWQGYEPDYVVKFDDDCRIITDDILHKIMQFYEANGNDYIVSPMNIKLLDNPKYMPSTIDELNLHGWPVRITRHVGGMFIVVPVDAFDAMVMAGGKRRDNVRGRFWRNTGWTNAYLENLHVSHEGQDIDRDYKF